MKTKYVIITVYCIICVVIGNYGQGVGINTTGAAPDSSAILDVSATNKGVLFPRMTTAQRNAIVSPVNGLLIYNIDIGCYQHFDGVNWLDLCGEQKEKPLMLPWRPGLGSANDAIRNIYQDQYVIVTIRTGNSTFSVLLESNNLQVRSYTLEMASATLITSGIIIDSSLYLLMTNSPSSTVYQVFRYDLYNINAGGMLVSFVGLPLSTPSLNTMIMTSEGSSVYFNYNAGNSVNDYVIAKYSITSPTVFTYQSSITCGSTPDSFRRIIVDGSGNLYGGTENTTNNFVKYNSAGVFLYQLGPFNLGLNNKVLNWGNTFYVGENSFGCYMKIWLE